MNKTGPKRDMTLVARIEMMGDEIKSTGLRIKHHEDKIVFLQGQMKLADDAILGMQVTAGSYEAGSSRGSENEGDQLVDQVLNFPDSAAVLFYNLKQQLHPPPWVMDVVGILASLATIDSDKLSRILSQYLGTDTMLAVVCRTEACARELEAFKKGVQGLRASSEGQSAVICMDKISPYAGGFVANDPQRRLDLLRPRLQNGETPPGFIGYAVNMINMHACGVGLRENLFFGLFSRLQVYKTEADMLQARHLLVDGAVSLDGATLRRRGVKLCFEKLTAEAGLRFARSSSKECILPEAYYRTVQGTEKEVLTKERLVEDMQREMAELNQEKLRFEEKKQKFLKLLADMGSSEAASKLSLSLGLPPFKKE